MKSCKLFIGTTASVTVICPACGKAKSVETCKIPAHINSFRAKCPCGEVFTVNVERRRYYRRDTDFYGTLYRDSRKNRAITDIHVVDLSMKGMKCSCEWQNYVKMEIKVGDEFHVRLLMGDDENGWLEGKVVVRNVRQDILGLEFLSLDEHSRKVLGFFMLP